MNKLYEACNSFMGKNTDKIGLRFDVRFSEIKNIRRNDVNALYFSVVEQLLDKDEIKDLYLIRNFIMANDRSGEIYKKINHIVLNIANGGHEK